MIIKKKHCGTVPDLLKIQWFIYVQCNSFQLDRTPPDVSRGSYQPPQSQGFDVSLANHGPSSRPPPHPAIHSNPYDDPYYYYGALEIGATQGHSISSPRGTGQANMVPRLRLDGDVSGGIADTVCLRKERLVIVTITVSMSKQLVMVYPSRNLRPGSEADLSMSRT